MCSIACINENILVSRTFNYPHHVSPRCGGVRCDPAPHSGSVGEGEVVVSVIFVCFQLAANFGREEKQWQMKVRVLRPRHQPPLCSSPATFACTTIYVTALRWIKHALSWRHFDPHTISNISECNAECIIVECTPSVQYMTTRDIYVCQVYCHCGVNGDNRHLM